MFCAGGNQRDLAREKNAKKALELQKNKSAAEKEGNKGLTLEARKQRYTSNSLSLTRSVFTYSFSTHRDADMMREKQRMKEQKLAEAKAAGSGSKK